MAAITCHGTNTFSVAHLDLEYKASKRRFMPRHLYRLERWQKGESRDWGSNRSGNVGSSGRARHLLRPSHGSRRPIAIVREIWDVLGFKGNGPGIWVCLLGWFGFPLDTRTVLL